MKGLAGQQGLHGKVERFRQLSSKASKSMTELEPIHSDIEIERLEAMELTEPEFQSEENNPPNAPVALEVVSSTDPDSTEENAEENTSLSEQ